MLPILQCLTAEEWYLLEATRAVNQGIGRVIRHKNDYGAILLCDQRFEGQSFRAALSSWVRPHMKKHNSFGTMIRELRQFFVNAEKTVSSECVSWKKICPFVAVFLQYLNFLCVY
jgi:regulator of telomere elongation helicase 1